MAVELTLIRFSELYDGVFSRATNCVVAGECTLLDGAKPTKLVEARLRGTVLSGHGKTRLRDPWRVVIPGSERPFFGTSTTTEHDGGAVWHVADCVKKM